MLVGTPALRRAAQTLPLGRKDAGVLGLVALSSSVASAQVATDLWPEADRHGALNNLRQRIHRLRRATGARLVDMAETIVLAPDLHWPAEPDHAALDASPSAWDGELFGAYEYDDAPEFAAFVSAARKAWRETRRDALAAIASRAEKSRELARALVYAQRLLADEPLSEHAHRRLMRLHFLRGDRAAAVAAYEACERLLKDELGVRPDTETLELLETIEHVEKAGGRLPVRPATVPAALQRPPRMVGRDDQLRRLADAVAAGGIAVVVGEAGVGKSRLLQEWIAAVPAGTIVEAQARPGDVGVPYGAMHRLVSVLEHSAAGGPVAGAAPDPTPPDLAQRVETLLLAARARGVAAVAFDDLHFADSASVELLRALVDREALEGFGWAFAHRPLGMAEGDEALLRALADAPRAHWIALGPLSLAELATLVGMLELPGVDDAALAAALARHTGGNPLYVLETLRAMSSAGMNTLPRPQSITHLIDRRLGRLSEGALALGRVAAIAGPDFSPALAEHALATPALRLAGAWAELEAADVLRGSAFAHDLIRDGMLRATPRPIAAHAHRIVAEVLARSGAEPARVASHWAEAGEHARAGRAYRAAAERAQRAGRPREEAALLHEAARAFDACGASGEALAARALAIPPTVRSAGPGLALQASEPLLAAAAGTRQLGLVQAMHAVALIWAGRAVDAEAFAREALEHIDAHDEHLRLEATRTLAMARGLRGEPGEGIDLLRPWLDRLDGLPGLEQRIELCGAYTHLLLADNRFGQAVQVALRHQALARQAGDRLEELTALINLCAAYVRRGELAAAIDTAAAAAALDPADDQSRMLVGFNEAVRGFCLCGAGRFREGLERLESAHSSAAASAPGSAFEVAAAGYLAQVWLQLGQPARARRLLAADVERLAPHQRANQWMLRAMSMASAGEALGLLRRAVEIAGDGQGATVRQVAQLEIARRSEPAVAIELTAQVSAVAWAQENRPLATLADALRLDAQRRLDPAAIADAEVDALELHARQHRAPYPYLPELLLVCTRAYQTRGRAREARRCLDDALAWVRDEALPNLPPELHDGFLQRNPVNRELSAEAARAVHIDE